MDFLALAKARYSERSFTEAKVEQEKLERILEAGRVAPTAANRQPQRVLVVQEKDGLEKLGKAANIFKAPLALLVCCDTGKAWVRPFDGKNFADVDASIVTDHMMIAAASLGLGSVWIGYFKPDVLRKEFALPEGWEPLAILAVGHAAGEPSSPDRHDMERLPLAETTYFEHF